MLGIRINYILYVGLFLLLAISYSHATITVILPANGTNQTLTGKIFINISSTDTINASGTVLEWTNTTGAVSNVTPTFVNNQSGACPSNNCNYSSWNISAELFDFLTFPAFGNHYFKAYVWNNATNSNVSISQIYVVRIIPGNAPVTSHITNLTPGCFDSCLGTGYWLNTSDTTPEIMFNLTDFTFEQDLAYKIFINEVNDTEPGISNITNGTIVRRNLSALGNGTVRVKVESRNAANNYANTTYENIFYITVSSQAPVISYNISNNLNITSNTFNGINFTFVNTSGGAVFGTDLFYKIYMDGVNQTYDGVENATLNRIVQINFSNLYGVHVFNIETGDGVGNLANSSALTVRLNATPQIIFTTRNFTNTSDTTPTIRFNVTSPAVPIIGYKVFFDNGTGYINYTEPVNVTNGTEFNFTTPALANGTYKLKVEMTDVFRNNQNTTNFTFTVDDTAPSITISTSNSTTTDETPSLDFIISDNFFTGDLLYKLFDGENINSQGGGVPNGSSYSITAATLSVGSHTIKIEASDPAGNTVNSTARMINITAAPGSSSPGSSSTPGSSSASTSVTFIISLQANVPLTKNMSSAGTAVREIIISSAKAASGARIITTKRSSAPSNVGSVDGTAYSYFDINITGVQTSSLKNIAIKFSVPKAWISSNGFETSEIKLQRYNVTWQILPTTFVSENSSDVIFEATTPGFSTFAVVGKAIEESVPQNIPQPGTPPAQNEITTQAVDDTGGNTTETTPAAASAGFDPVVFSIVILVIVAIVLGTAYMFYNKEKTDRILAITKKSRSNKRDKENASAN